MNMLLLLCASCFFSSFYANETAVEKVNVQMQRFWHEKYAEAQEALDDLEKELADNPSDAELLDRKKRLVAAISGILRKLNKWNDETGGRLDIRSETALDEYVEHQYQKKSVKQGVSALDAFKGQFRERKAAIDTGKISRDLLQALMVMSPAQRSGLPVEFKEIITGMTEVGVDDPLRFYGARLKAHKQYQLLFFFFLGSDFSTSRGKVTIDGKNYNFSDYQLAQYIVLQMVAAYQREYQKNKRESEARRAKDVARATELATVRTFNSYAQRLWAAWLPLYFATEVYGLSMKDAGLSKAAYSPAAFSWQLLFEQRRALHLQTLALTVRKIYVDGEVSVFSEISSAWQHLFDGIDLPGSPAHAAEAYYLKDAWSKGAQSERHAWARRWYELCRLTGKLDTFGLATGGLSSSLEEIAERLSGQASSWDGELSRAAMMRYVLLTAQQHADEWGVHIKLFDADKDSLSDQWQSFADTLDAGLVFLGFDGGRFDEVLPLFLERIFTSDIASNAVNVAQLSSNPRAALAAYAFVLAGMRQNARQRAMPVDVAEVVPTDELDADITTKTGVAAARVLQEPRPRFASSITSAAAVPSEVRVDHLEHFKKVGLSASAATGAAIDRISDIAANASKRLSGAIENNNVDEMIAYINEVRAAIKQLGDVLKLQSEQMVSSTRAVAEQIQKASQLIVIASELIREGLVPQVDAMLDNIGRVLNGSKGTIQLGLKGAKFAGKMGLLSKGPELRDTKKAQDALVRRARELQTSYEGLFEESGAK